MQEAFEKIKERCMNEPKIGRQSLDAFLKIVNQVAEEYSHGHFGCNSNGEHEKCDGCGIVPTCKEKYKHWFGVQDEKDRWIPCSERLPEVPKEIEDEDCPEFNVTIKGATESTTLKYDGDGSWFDDFGYIYKVVAWQPLPKPYIPEENQTTPWKEHMMNRFMKGE